MSNLTDSCNWLIKDKLVIGGYPHLSELNIFLDWGVDIFVSLIEEFESLNAHEIPSNTRKYIHKYKPSVTFVNYPTPDGHPIRDDKTLAELVLFILRMLKLDKKIYLHCFGGHGRSAVVGACVLMAYLNTSADNAISMIRQLHGTRRIYPDIATPQTLEQLQQIKRYRPPIKVVITGDRNSSLVFQDIIRMELSKLPYSSTIITGGCRGIDTIGEKIAKEMGFRVKKFPAEWNIHGNRAGPIRNKAMIDMLNPATDMVLAFHPDIQSSRGTINCMTQAYRKGIKVYLSDLKEKIEFQGTLEF